MQLFYDNDYAIDYDIEMHFLHERPFIVYHHGDPVTRKMCFDPRLHYISCCETRNLLDIFFNIKNRGLIGIFICLIVYLKKITQAYFQMYERCFESKILV